MRGFNVGVTVSLGDMELALDYVNNPELFMPDIENIVKSKQTQKEYNQEEIQESTASTAVLMSDNATLEYVNEEDEDDTDNLDDSICIEGDNDYFEEDIDINEEEIELDLEDEEEIEIELEDEEEIEIDLEDEEEIELDLEEEQINVKEEKNTKTDSLHENTKIIDTRDKVEEGQRNNREAELEKQLRLALEKLNNLENKVNNTVDNVKSGQIQKPSNIHQSKTNTNQHNEQHSINNKGISKTTNIIKQPLKNKSRDSQQNATTISNDINNNRLMGYNGMDIDTLYKAVKSYMDRKGVNKSIIDKSVLEAEFGTQNIRKLIVKSYLIVMGKGVTAGR